MGLLQFSQQLRARMAIAIAQSAGNHGPRRRNPLQEIRPRGTGAAVMTDLQKRAGQIRLPQHGLLDRPLGVSFHQHRALPVSDPKHQRIVVLGCSTGHIVRTGRQHVDACCAKRERIAGAQRTYPGPKRYGLVEQSPVRLHRGIVAHPQFRRPEVAQHGRQAAHVIGMRVTQCHRIKPSNAARPQRGGDHFFPNVELLRGLPRSAPKPASIHQQGFAVGRNQQD